MLDLELVTMEIPENCNIIVGQSHFIKTVEDVYEVMMTSVPGIRFGLAFNEASGPCLIRRAGNDTALVECAGKNAQAIGAGHAFVLLMQNAYPINVLNALKNTQEVCTIFAATANPLQLVVAKSDQGKGIVGVIDGASPKGMETDADVHRRKEFLRNVTGYKYL